MRHGFTLSELLIALAILGVIATFTIPKVLQSQADEKRKSVFREVIANVSEILYVETLKGANWTNNVDTIVISRMNHVKYCSDGLADGCWVHSFPANMSAGSENTGALILHNGAIIGGLYNGASVSETFAVDWNGAAAPNVEGDDQMMLRMCYRNDGANCSGGQKPGTVRWDPASAASQTLYELIFRN